MTSTTSTSQTSGDLGMAADDAVWRALNQLRASHRDLVHQGAECAIAALSDADLEEIRRAVSPGPAPAVETVPTQLVVVGSDDAVPSETSEIEDGAPRFQVGDRVVYDPEAPINDELDDYTGLGVCTVTALDTEGCGQLLSFVDERGDMHDGWWADRFKTAAVARPTDDAESAVTYFVAFRSPTGYGSRVLPRPRIVTAADVTALTDLLATDVGGAVVPLNWIELPPGAPGTTQPHGVDDDRGSPPEVRPLLTPVGPTRGTGRRVLSGSVPALDGAAQPAPRRAAAPGERLDLAYRPRRAR